MDGDDGALLLTLQPTTANSGDQAFGVAVGAVPDVTGDGLPDFVVGADEEEGSGGLLNEGRVYLVRDVPNDSCESLAASTPLFEGVQSFTNVGATGGGSGPECDGEHLGSDIWFAFQVTCDGLVTIQSCSDASFDTLLAVYEGCDVTLPGGVCVIGGPLACDDDGCGGERRGAAVSFPASSGECFRVRVGGFDGEQGQGSLVLECFLSCPGDLDTSGSVSSPDVRLFLDAWGGSDPLADLNDDGVIDADDLAILLGNWGPC